MTRAERTRLERRVRAACNPITGLTPQEYEQHIAGIVRVVIEARARGRS